MLRTLCVLVLLCGLFAEVSPAVAGVNEESVVVEKVAFEPGEEAEQLTSEVDEESGLLTTVIMIPEKTEVAEAEATTSSVQGYQVYPLPVNIAQNQTPLSAESNYENSYAMASSPATQVQLVQVEDKEASEFFLTPMFGTTSFVGRWNDHTKNSWTFGLILEKPVSESFSLELEGSYARNWITYSNYIHAFNQWGIGGNGKLYLLTGKVRPYVGAGIVGTFYENMTGGPLYPYEFDHMLGSGQLIAGGDVSVTKKVSVGVRGAFIRPLFNKPGTLHNGFASAPGFEETAAINTSFVRLMGAVKIAF